MQMIQQTYDGLSAVIQWINWDFSRILMFLKKMIFNPS